MLTGDVCCDTFVWRYLSSLYVLYYTPHIIVKSQIIIEEEK